MRNTLFGCLLLALIGGPALADPDNAGQPITPRFEQAAAEVSPPVSGFTAATLPGTMIFANSTVANRVPEYTIAADFNADGTGVSWDGISSLRLGSAPDVDAVAKPFTWSVDDGVLTMDFVDNIAFESFTFFSPPYTSLIDFYGFDQSVADFLNAATDAGQYFGGQERLVLSVDARTVAAVGEESDQLLTRTTDSLEYRIDDLLTALGWPGALPVGKVRSTITQRVYDRTAIANAFSGMIQANQRWLLPVVYVPQDARLNSPAISGFYIDRITLNAGGMSTDGLLGSGSFAWAATSDGIELTRGTERYVYTPIESDGTVYLALISYYVDNQIKFRTAQEIGMYDDTGDQLSADLVQTLPLFWQGGVNLSIAAFYQADGVLDPTWVFGYSLNNDGTGTRVFGPFVPDCANDPFFECFTLEGAPAWTWSATGERVVRSRTSSSTRERSWDVATYVDDDTALMLEWELNNSNGGAWAFAIYPRINRLILTDLALGWPAEYAASPGLQNRRPQIGSDNRRGNRVNGRGTEPAIQRGISRR